MIERLKNYDFTLMITPILLSAFGIVMIYSASMVTAVVAEEVESTYYLSKQLKWFVLGLIGFIITCSIPYQTYQKFIKPIVLGSIILLLIVLFFGDTVHNATRTISFGPIRIQPSEFVKLTVILYLASIYAKKQSYIDDFARGVLPPLILTGIMLSLIMLQPDIGTSSIIFLIALAIIISSGIRFKHLLALGLIGLTLLAIAIPKMTTDTRIARFTGAYQPFTAPDDSGYHLIQSYIAIGSGGITGTGLGQSVQKLGYLWGAHTDFIMAIIAEELGFIGVMIVLIFLAMIVLRGIFIARKCKNSFGTFLAIGLSSMIGIQTFINLGSISGILPITGVPLPFLSYGGSSLLATLLAMGILNNIAKEVKTEDQEEQPTKQSVTEPKSFRRHTYRIGP